MARWSHPNKVNVWDVFLVKGQVERSLPYPRNKPQQSVNNFLSCILDNSNAGQLLSLIIAILAAFLGQSGRDDIATIS